MLAQCNHNTNMCTMTYQKQCPDVDGDPFCSVPQCVPATGDCIEVHPAGHTKCPGACCIAGTGCAYLDLLDCMDAGGIWSDSDTTCATVTCDTVAPTTTPTAAPTTTPTIAPTAAPTTTPTIAPTAAPTTFCPPTVHINFTDVDIFIPDLSQVQVKFNVTTHCYITDMTVDLQINHTYISDIGLVVLSKEAISVSLIDVASGQDCNENSMDITLDDASVNGILSYDDDCSVGGVTGVFNPADSLSAFDGSITTSDEWFLLIEDQVGGDVGNLVGLALDFQCLCGPPPEPTPVPTAAPTPPTAAPTIAPTMSPTASPTPMPTSTCSHLSLIDPFPPDGLWINETTVFSPIVHNPNGCSFTELELKLTIEGTLLDIVFINLMAIVLGNLETYEVMLDYAVCESNLITDVYKNSATAGPYDGTQNCVGFPTVPSRKPLYSTFPTGPSSLFQWHLEIRRSNAASSDFRHLRINEAELTFNCDCPTPSPTPSPTALPTASPTPEPTALPTASPTPVPTAVPICDFFDFTSGLVNGEYNLLGNGVTTVTGEHSENCIIQDMVFSIWIDHNRITDITAITLSHNGIDVFVTENITCIGSAFDRNFRDTGPGNQYDNVTPCTGFAVNRFPVDPFAVFNGENAFGLWTLNITDDVSGFSGTVLEADLEFNCACDTASPTASPTVSPTSSPTASPTLPTASPTSSPTSSPTGSPTGSPTPSPTPAPTVFCPETVHVEYSPVPAPIADYSGSPTTTVFVMNVTEECSIAHMTVRLQIDHTFVSDLARIILHSAFLTRDLIDVAGTTGNCNSDALPDMDVLFNNSETTVMDNYATYCPPIGSFAPKDPLFTGGFAAALWQLQITDHQPVDTGVLIAWEMDFACVCSTSLGETVPLNEPLVPIEEWYETYAHTLCYMLNDCGYGEDVPCTSANPPEECVAAGCCAVV